MIEALLIAAVILLYTFLSLFSRLFTDTYPGDKHVAPEVFAVVSGLVVCVISLFFGIGTNSSFEFMWQTLLLGLVNAIVLFGYDEFIIKASGTGSYSIMMVFSLGGGIIFPAIAKSIIPYTGGSVQVISWVQIVAIVVICAAVYMVSYKKADSGSRSSKLFLIFCFALAICNGLYGIFLDVQDQVTGAGQKQLMIIYTFLGSAVIAAVKLLIAKGKAAPRAFLQSKRSLIHLSLAAIVSALAVNVLVLLIGVVDLTLLYTFDNAGVMLLSALASALIFKEKLSPLNITGCIVMALGLICMSQFAAIDTFFRNLFFPA